MAWEIIKLVFYLLIFAVVIWATYYTCKKLAVHGSSFGSSKYMKLLDRMMLGKDVGIAVMKIGNRYLLVSQTPDGVGLLREFSEDEFREIELSAPQPNQTQNPFASVMENQPFGKLFGFLGNNKNGNRKEGFDFSRFLNKRNDDGEILGTYDGDLNDAASIDFDEILKKGMKNSDSRNTKIKTKHSKNNVENNSDGDAVDEILKSVDKRRKSFDLRKEENDATDEG